MNAGQTLALAPGKYGAVTVSGTLNLSGGLYELRSLNLQPDARVTAVGAATVRISTGLAAGDRTRLLPAAPLRAGSLRLIVNGTIDANNDSLVLGTDAQLTAVVVARNAFRAGDRLIASGAIAAQDVILGNDGRLAFDTGFGCGSNASCNDDNACTVDACIDATCVVSQRHGVQRRQRLHADRHLPGGRLHGRQPGDLRGERPVPRRGRVQPGDGRVLEPAQAERHGVQRRQRLHADRHLPGRAPAPGGNPVTCTASDQCHTAGTCNPATGVCSNPAKANGTACNDGNACTQTDTCQAGACTGANPVTCAASDQCHVAGTCNPATGMCSNPARSQRHRVQRRQRVHADRHLPGGRLLRGEPGHLRGERPVPRRGHVQPGDGRVLEPGEGRTARRATTATRARRPTAARRGPAWAANPVTCTASDQCHAAGVCNPATGVVLEPGEAERHGVQRRRRLHLDDACHGTFARAPGRS